ncbi:MAG: hypothetical protein GXP22_11865 [Gammaproteobacteria bacterium]|nr:hypothetical protein [Gammaproteobacteria bacterium]
MNKFTKSIVAGALVMGSSAAMAEITANVALTTNYVFRGLTQTVNDGAIQGGFDYTHESGFYAGTWASNVNYGMADSISLEVDTYFGFGGDLGNGASYDLGFIRYNYDGDSSVNINEVYVGVGYDFSETISGSASYAYSSDYGSGLDASYLSAGVDVVLPEGFGASFTLSRADGDTYGANDYLDFKLGLTKSFEGLDFEVNYTDTDLSATQAVNNDNSGRFMLTVSKSL